MHVNLLKLYPYACKLTDINSGCIQTYEAYRFTVTYTYIYIYNAAPPEIKINLTTFD